MRACQVLKNQPRVMDKDVGPGGGLGRTLRTSPPRAAAGKTLLRCVSERAAPAGAPSMSYQDPRTKPLGVAL